MRQLGGVFRQQLTGLRRDVEREREERIRADDKWSDILQAHIMANEEVYKNITELKTDTKNTKEMVAKMFSKLYNGD